MGVTVQNPSMQTGFGNPVSRDSAITSVSAETLPAGSDATASYVNGALTLGIPKGDKGDTGEAAEMILLEVSHPVVVYNPNAASGERCTPSSLTLNSYKVSGNTKTPFTAFRLELGRVVGAAYYGSSGESNVSSATLSISANFDPATQSLQARLIPTAFDFMNPIKVNIPVVYDGTNGQDGAPGQDGKDGTNGTNGTDGVSPSVTITSITGGNRVSITDKDHPSGQSFDVMDGQNGTNGADGATFTPSVSSSGVISWTNDGNKQNPQSVDLCAAVLAALPTWSGGSY